MKNPMKNTGHPENCYYADTAPKRSFKTAPEAVDCDVAIIGGGFTGLGAALELAQAGHDVAVFEAAQIGSGASGRNGGQIHTGQRLDPEYLSHIMGEDQAAQLWQIAMDARQNLSDLIDKNAIDCGLKSGLMHVWHRPKFEADDRAYADFVRKNYGYELIRFMDRQEVADELGTNVYCGGIYDGGGGHLHPLKFALGLAEAAKQCGAKIYEHAAITQYEDTKGGVILTINGGQTVRAQTVLLCGNGYMGGLDDQVDRYVLPINNFILTTAPLGDRGILKSDYAAADSRFVVNYWRKTEDGRLLFGGGENYSPHFPKDIKAFVRANMLKLYPQLADIEITHAWGGTLAITLNRAPFVRRLSPRMMVSAGYSGQGVALAPYFGKLLAKAVLGDDRDFTLLSQLPVPAFWGGKLLRTPAMVAGLSYYALLDRLA